MHVMDATEDNDLQLLNALRDFERTSHSNESRTLFEKYNQMGIWAKEHGHTCGGCVRRVCENARGHLRSKGLL